jgi:DNA-binding GntR family transcriptional regulator
MAIEMSIDGGDDVYGRVRNAILHNQIAPGAVMSQVALAQQLGISRTPLREALRMLQTERLIEAEPNRRVRVAPMTPRNLEELYVMRVTLEAEAARLSVPLLRPNELARLEGCMAEMGHYAEQDDYFGWAEPHRRFHRGLTAPAGTATNEHLDQLFDHTERYRRLHIGYGPTPWATADHRKIIDACKAGDRERTANLIATHLGRTGLEVSELLDPTYDPLLLKTAIIDAGGEVVKTGAGKGRPRRTSRSARPKPPV